MIRLVAFFIIMVVAPAYAKLDMRENVNWANYPEIVALIQDGAHVFCTGQYVAPNIILTSQHCTKQRNEDSYKIRLYDGRETNAILKESGDAKNVCVEYDNEACLDYALLLIEDPQFYSEHYVNVVSDWSVKESLDMLGFGWLRVFTDAEIKQLKTILQNLFDKEGYYWHENGRYVAKTNESGAKHIEIILRDYADAIAKEGIPDIRDNEFQLKKQTCDIATVANSNGKFTGTCAAFFNDTGAGMYDKEKKLYAILANKGYHVNGVFSPTSFFAVVLEKLSKKYPPQSVLSADKSPDDAPDETSSAEINLMEKDMAQVEQNIMDTLPKTKDLTDEEFLGLLDNMVGYDVLKKRYEQARAREQSLANRMLGAVAIGAGGIGGAMALSAVAEQRADADAERDMTAYLATFTCDYGAGRNIRGGDKQIELPGANALFQLNTEYRNLAADLRTRKAALGIAPGIESEHIEDAATTGLYDNASIGKTDGAFTSIARALSDAAGDDAAEWAAQKADAKKKLQTGGIVGGIGIIGGGVGNLIINSNADK